MKLKTTHVIVIVIILMLATVVATLAGVGVINFNGRNSAQTTKPDTSKTSPPSDSADKNSSKPETQTPPVTAGTYYDISYGSDPAQKFDIYIPETTATQLPLVIFVHGGAWSAGDKSDVSAIGDFLAAEDFVVINTNYRLLPYSYPAPLEDFQLLLTWVNQNAQRYRIDVTRIGMSGHSAGGHLTALYALTQDKDYIVGGSTLPKVYAVATLAGGFTLDGINITSDRRQDTIIQWLSTANPQSLGLPIDQVDRGDNVTFLLLHGSADVNSPPQQSVLFYQELTANGVPAQIKIYPGRTHITLISGIPSNDEVGQDLVAFFNDKLK
jgi:acetyl esterase/lipase